MIPEAVSIWTNNFGTTIILSVELTVPFILDDGHGNLLASWESKHHGADGFLSCIPNHPESKHKAHQPWLLLLNIFHFLISLYHHFLPRLHNFLGVLHLISTHPQAKQGQNTAPKFWNEQTLPKWANTSKIFATPSHVCSFLGGFPSFWCQNQHQTGVSENGVYKQVCSSEKWGSKVPSNCFD